MPEVSRQPPPTSDSAGVVAPEAPLWYVPTPEMQGGAPPYLGMHPLPMHVPGLAGYLPQFFLFPAGMVVLGADQNAPVLTHGPGVEDGGMQAVSMPFAPEVPQNFSVIVAAYAEGESGEGERDASGLAEQSPREGQPEHPFGRNGGYMLVSVVSVT